MKKVFILGGLIYTIEYFLLPSYDFPNLRTPEDDFNFYHSSARITVEYAIGEIDLRLGIFWKRFTCSLGKVSVIAEGAMRLHNFEIDYSKEDSESGDIENKRSLFNEDILKIGELQMVVGNNACRTRNSNSEIYMRFKGLKLRD